MIFVLFFFFICILMYFEYKRTKLIFNYFSLFLIYWYLYTIGIFFSGEELTQYNLFAAELILIGGLFFIIGYYFFPLGSKSFYQKKIEKLNKLPNIKIFLLLLTFVALAFFIYIVFIKIGFQNYFFTSRANRSLIVRPYSKIMIFIDLFNIISSIALLFYIKTKKRFYKYIFILVFTVGLFHAILTISRNNLVLLIFPIVYILHYYNYLKTKAILLLLLTGVLVASLWKVVLGSLFLYGNLDLGLMLQNFKFPREFIVWQEISNNLLSKEQLYLYGKSYIEAFSNFIYPHHVENLSLWYVRNYEPHVFEIGGGRGFSNILEAYLNFDILGVIVIFFILGNLVYLFQLKSRNNIVLFLSYAFSLSFIHRIFRSDFVSLTKTWWWMYFISFVFLFTLFKILKKVSSEGKLFNK